MNKTQKLYELLKRVNEYKWEVTDNKHTVQRASSGWIKEIMGVVK